MKIISLVENVSKDPSFKCVHGLSLYIETSSHKILFDVGPNEFFAENALQLGVNIEDVDIVIISHGHHDHGGGLRTFFSLNSKAKVYIHHGFFDPHFSIGRTPEPRFIGIDPELQASNRFVYTNDTFPIDDELFIFANPETHDLISESNKLLLVKDGENNNNVVDPFAHEHNLIISLENQKKILFCGCSHRGIVNILAAAEKHTGRQMDIVIGGFHLMNPATKTIESKPLLEKIAEELLKREKTMYYTCHCTGIDAFNELHDKMKEKVSYFSTAMKLDI